MQQSPRLSLSYVQPAQAQKHVTVNESFRRLDALTQLTVRSQTIAAEPSAPAEGDAYILPASSTGASWASYSAGNVAAFQDGAWVEVTAMEGFRAWVSDSDQFVAFDGTNWTQVSGGSEAAEKFGVNTTADTTNRLSVKSDAILFNYDDVTPGNDDCIVKVNKKAVGDTASQIFQTGASGHAELGLMGDDYFRIKVSANGSSWKEAVKIDKTTGFLTLAESITLLGNHPAIIFQDNAGGTQNIYQFRANPIISGAQKFGDIGFYFDDVLTTAGSTTNNKGFYMNSSGDVTFSSDINLLGGLQAGSPTGGNKGAGTINAQGVYDDNTLLTCYVFDQALDGAIDPAKWDGKVPDRIIEAEVEETEDLETGEIITREITPAKIEPRAHAPMRKFAARIGTPYDPLTLDGYAKHWRDKRHLTAMPNETTFDPVKGMAAGAWIQRLVETVEIQAVLIEELNQRTKAVGDGRKGGLRP